MSNPWLRGAKVLGTLGGVLWVGVGLVQFCQEAGACGERPWRLLETVALLCLVVGVVGFHVRFRDEYGRFGGVASALIALGLAGSLLDVALGWRSGAFSSVWTGYPVLVAGWTLLGVVLVRRSVASRAGGLLLLSALPLGLGIAYLSLFVLVPAFDLVVDENVLSSGPVVVYGIAWVVVSDSM